MRIDIEYIKSLLDVALENDHPDFRIDHEDIKSLWSGDDEKLNKLVFHMEILEDQNLIENSINSNGIGFRRMSNGQFIVSIIPLRLTAQGHQFASDLTKPGVIEQLTTSFKDAGPSEAVKVVFALGKKALEKKLEGIME
jgi:hypothetical protein